MKPHAARFHALAVACVPWLLQACLLQTTAPSSEEAPEEAPLPLMPEARQCPAVCERMAEAACSRFHSVQGCVQVCPYSTFMVSSLCRTALARYFECNATTSFECDADGIPVSRGCESASAELDSCTASAPY
jgi:hypothetical protein